MNFYSKFNWMWDKRWWWTVRRTGEFQSQFSVWGFLVTSNQHVCEAPAHWLGFLFEKYFHHFSTVPSTQLISSAHNLLPQHPLLHIRAKRISCRRRRRWDQEGISPCILHLIDDEIKMKFKIKWKKMPTRLWSSLIPTPAFTHWNGKVLLRSIYR